MIQATDFVCPTCGAQVSKSCTEQRAVFAFGKWELRPAQHKFGKPHADRRRLAKAKRKEIA